VQPASKSHQALRKPSDTVACLGSIHAHDADDKHPSRRLRFFVMDGWMDHFGAREEIAPTHVWKKALMALGAWASTNGVQAVHHAPPLGSAHVEL
jgi:hypothetical protein